MAIDLYAIVDECSDPDAALADFAPLANSGLLCMSREGTSFRPSVYNARIFNLTGIDVCEYDDVSISPDVSRDMSEILASSDDPDMIAIGRYFSVCAKHGVRVLVM